MTRFNNKSQAKVTALELLQTQCTEQVRAWSATHGDLLKQIAGELQKLHKVQVKHAETQTQKMLH